MRIRSAVHQSASLRGHEQVVAFPLELAQKLCFLAVADLQTSLHNGQNKPHLPKPTHPQANISAKQKQHEIKKHVFFYVRRIVNVKKKKKNLVYFGRGFLSTTSS